MGASKQADDGFAVPYETEGDRELLAPEEAFRTVDRIEGPEDVTAFGGGIESPCIEEFSKFRFGGGSRAAETGGIKGLPGESEKLIDHGRAAFVERIDAFLADDAISMLDVRGPQGGGDRHLYREVRDGHGAAVVLEKIDEIRPLGCGFAGDATGSADGMNDGIEGGGIHETLCSNS